MDWGNFLTAGGKGFANSIFGDPGAPYDKAMQQYQQAMEQGKQIQNPFYQGGVDAIPQYQQWAESMKDPSGFINNLMGGYQESPWAKFKIDQGLRANTNAASASGLIGSTPYQQAGIDYAEKVEGEDLNNWLQNVLGINTQYGGALGNEIGMGQNAANALTNMYGNFGEQMGTAAYDKERAQQNRWQDILGAGAQIGKYALSL